MEKDVYKCMNLSDIPYIEFVKENCANSFDEIIFQKTGHYISVEKIGF